MSWAPRVLMRVLRARRRLRLWLPRRLRLPLLSRMSCWTASWLSWVASLRRVLRWRIRWVCRWGIRTPMISSVTMTLKTNKAH